MLEPVMCAGSAQTHDWTASALGPRAGWPLPLRLSVDILLNTPLPMLLAWGAEPVVVFNENYAALAGPHLARAPGGSVPAILPVPLAACPQAFARARQGETLLLPSQPLPFAAGHGATQPAFDLHLTPIRDEHGQVCGVLCALATCAHPAPVQAPAALRILVVEDNLDSQYLVCEMLKAFGHHAEGVDNGEAALASLAAAEVDVLFTDVSLPGISGVELARQALRLRPALKVIFASGYGESLLRHVEFPFLSLQKPYELDQLQDALADISHQLQA
jgi:CheY-like chemotaxis protein